jgi:hypothetical protein
MYCNKAPFLMGVAKSDIAKDNRLVKNYNNMSSNVEIPREIYFK